MSHGQIRTPVAIKSLNSLALRPVKRTGSVSLSRYQKIYTNQSFRWRVFFGAQLSGYAIGIRCCAFSSISRSVNGNRQKVSAVTMSRSVLNSAKRRHRLRFEILGASKVNTPPSLSHHAKSVQRRSLSKDTLLSASTSVRSVEYIQFRFGATTASIAWPTANIC